MLIIYLASPVMGQNIKHELISTAIPGQSLQFDMFVDEPVREVLRCNLMYRNENQITFMELNMDPIGSNNYSTIIPGYFIENANLHYFLVVEFVDQGMISMPNDSPFDNPFIIEVQKQFTETSIPTISQPSLATTTNPGELSGLVPEVMIISPLPESTVKPEDMVIALSYFSMKNIDLKKIKILLDGNDITSQSNIHLTHLSCTFPGLLKGRHIVSILMKNNLGQSYKPVEWEFNSEKATSTGWFSQMAQHRGRIWTTMSESNFDGLSKSVNNLNANYMLDLDWMKIRMSGFQSSLDSEYEQTKNRYSFKFSNKNINLYLGDLFPAVNSHAMTGKRVRGVGAEINYKLAKLNVVSGTLAREIQGNPDNGAMTISNYIEPQPQFDQKGIIQISRDNYAFKRDINAANIGFGFPRYLYFNLNFIKAKDNILSVYNIIDRSSIDLSSDILTIFDRSSEHLNIQNGDTSIVYADLKGYLSELVVGDYDLELKSDQWEGDKPKDNLVLGTDFLFSFDKKRITVKTGLTFSLLNQNIWESISSVDELDTLASDTTIDGKFMDSYDIPDNIEAINEYFQLGINQVPLVPVDVYSDKSTFYKVMNLPSVVYDIDTRFHYAGHSLQYRYYQVGPEFNSLSNPYMQTDIRKRIFSDRLRLFGNRMFLFLKWTRKDYGIDLDDENTISTNRYDGNLSLYPGENLPTMNIGVSSIYRENGKEKRLETVSVEGVSTYTGNDTTYSITTDRREETATQQFNLSLTDVFELAGEQRLSANIFSAEKKDMISEIRFKDNKDYFSPRSLSSNLSLNLHSNFSEQWESNIIYNTSYFDSGIATENHPEYYQQQGISRFEFKLIRHHFPFVRTFKTGVSYTVGDGTQDFRQIGIKLSAVHSIVDIFKLSWNFEWLRKTLDETDTQSNTMFRAKLLYTI